MNNSSVSDDAVHSVLHYGDDDVSYDDGVPFVIYFIIIIRKSLSIKLLINNCFYFVSLIIEIVIFFFQRLSLKFPMTLD
jgi:hypothetical protein